MWNHVPKIRGFNHYTILRTISKGEREMKKDIGVFVIKFGFYVDDVEAFVYNRYGKLWEEGIEVFTLLKEQQEKYFNTGGENESLLWDISCALKSEPKVKKKEMINNRASLCWGKSFSLKTIKKVE